MKRILCFLVLAGMLGLLADGTGQASSHQCGAPGQPACPPPPPDNDGNNNQDAPESLMVVQVRDCLQAVKTSFCTNQLFDALFEFLVQSLCDAVESGTPTIVPLDPADDVLILLRPELESQTEIAVSFFRAPGASACNLPALGDVDDDHEGVDDFLVDPPPAVQRLLFEKFFDAHAGEFLSQNGGSSSLEDPRHLVVSNIGSSGDDGVELNCSQGIGYDQEDQMISVTQSSSFEGTEPRGFLGESIVFSSSSVAEAIFDLLMLVCETSVEQLQSDPAAVSGFFDSLNEFEIDRILFMSSNEIPWMQALLELIRAATRCLLGGACPAELSSSENPNLILSASLSCVASMAATPTDPEDQEPVEVMLSEFQRIFQLSTDSTYTDSAAWSCLEGAAAAAAYETTAVGVGGSIIITGGYTP